MSGGPEAPPNSGMRSRVGGESRRSEAEEGVSADSATPQPDPEANEQASEAKSTDATATPVLRIVTADATPEEIAVLVAVFAAMASATAEAEPEPVPAWNAPHRLVRGPHQHGPDGWRSSGLPR